MQGKQGWRRGPRPLCPHPCSSAGAAGGAAALGSAGGKAAKRPLTPARRASGPSASPTAHARTCRAGALACWWSGCPSLWQHGPADRVSARSRVRRRGWPEVTWRGKDQLALGPQRLGSTQDAAHVRGRQESTASGGRAHGPAALLRRELAGGGGPGWALVPGLVLRGYGGEGCNSTPSLAVLPGASRLPSLGLDHVSGKGKKAVL